MARFPLKLTASKGLLKRKLLPLPFWPRSLKPHARTTTYLMIDSQHRYFITPFLKHHNRSPKCVGRSVHSALSTLIDGPSTNGNIKMSTEQPVDTGGCLVITLSNFSRGALTWKLIKNFVNRVSITNATSYSLQHMIHYILSYDCDI